MKTGNINTVKCDVLVIGSGGAALRAAIEARKRDVDVVLVSKSRVGYGNNTVMAGGLLAVATGSRDKSDSPEMHFLDTARQGRFMSDQKMVEVLVNSANDEINQLQDHGMRLRKRDGEYTTLWVPGHTYARTLVTANSIGTDFTLPLVDSARRLGVKLVQRVQVLDLLKREDAVAGALGLGETGEIYLFTAGVTVLATGGLAQLFMRTDNAVGTNGDGMVMAWEAGASLRDMEFVQFYPTSLGERGSRGVAYEILVAREGARLTNSLGEDILEKNGISGLVNMTRDRVSRAIAIEISEGRGVGGYVNLDVSAMPQPRLEKLAVLMPGELREKRTMLVTPNTHFTCGGIKVDEDTKTGVDGLLAAGEVCAGIHGANRIASNAITEIFVFGAIAGREAAEEIKKMKMSRQEPAPAEDSLDRIRLKASQKGNVSPDEMLASIKKTMWTDAGMIRSEKSLRKAAAEISNIKNQVDRISVADFKEFGRALSIEKMITAAEIIIAAALQRTESRGVHYRQDYPQPDDRQWLANITVTGKGSRISLSVDPVKLSSISP